MKPFVGWITIAMLIGVMPAQAQVYKWVGPDGKIQYGDTPPPPSATKIRPQAVDVPAASANGGTTLPYEVAEAVRKNPVTLYSSANCTPCDSARTMLISRGVPFTEKTVRTNDDVTYLREVSGDSQVPVLMVGSRKHQGYAASEWEASLTGAGYPAANKLPKTYRNPPPQAAAPQKAAPEPEPVQEASTPAPASASPSPAGDAPPGFRF